MTGSKHSDRAPGYEQATEGAGKSRRRLRKWLAWGIPLLVLAYAVVLAVSALIAYGSLRDVIPLAEKVQSKVAEGDTAGAQSAVDEVAGKTAVARSATDHALWRGVEWLPLIGDDVASVRLAAAAADDLVRDALAPFASVDISAVAPKNGAIDLDAVRALAQPMSDAAVAAEKVQIDLSEVDTASLLPPVQSAVGELTGAVAALWPTLVRLDELMPHLPVMLGADGPRNYIVIVQNNAEARTTGGNPASLMMLTADQGRLSITQQAASTDFNNGRPAPIADLDPATETLYGSRVGQYVQDTTMSPRFDETARLVRAFWQETYGDAGVGVLSLDPVALSYILGATGPVALPDGGQLTRENAVDALLNGVYFKYPGNSAADFAAQDAYFAAAAGGVFDKITSGSTDIVKLAQAFGKAGAEGRIYFSSTDPIESQAAQGTTLSNPLPADNEDETALAVFVNDTTEGKLDYYADMEVEATSNVCEAATGEAPTFTTTATYNYNLQPGDVASLPIYISTGRYFERGVKATDVVFYGPVGGTYVSAKVDGAEVQPDVGTMDEGRPAVRIRVENQPATSHTFEVTFSGAPDQEYGPLSVVHTPLVKPVPVETSSPGCG